MEEIREEDYRRRRDRAKVIVRGIVLDAWLRPGIKLKYFPILSFVVTGNGNNTSRILSTIILCKSISSSWNRG